MKIDLHKLLKFALSCIVVLVTVTVASCKKYGQQENDPKQVRKVLLLYADGYNNLPGYMIDDIKELGEASPKEYLRDHYSVLVFKHMAKNYDYRTKVKPLLTELYKDTSGNIITDTVKVYPDTMTTSSIHGLRLVMEDVKNLYPAAEYGLIYSSHGTGWIPEEYYDKYNDDEVSIFSTTGLMERPSVTGRIDLLSAPMFKSLGCQGYYEGSALRTKEMDVRKLQNAFPMHLKYVILDACLMGGIETAYQLRGVTDKVIFSACEVPSGGFDYKNLPERLLYPVIPDFKAVCDDYFALHHTGTVALVNCSSLEGLATVCSPLFKKYSAALSGLKASEVQGFYRGNHPWYFDLRDMFVKADISSEDLAALDAALDACIEHKVNSDSFMSVDIKTYCGLSVYMPSVGNAELDAYYKGYDWAAATTRE